MSAAPIAVTPSLWVGTSFPENVSGMIILMDTDDPQSAVEQIQHGATVVVPSVRTAKRVLYKLGLTEQKVYDRIRFAFKETV